MTPKISTALLRTRWGAKQASTEVHVSNNLFVFRDSSMPQLVSEPITAVGALQRSGP